MKTKKPTKPDKKFKTTIDLDSETKKMLSEIKKSYGINKGSAIKQSVKEFFVKLKTK